MGFWVPAMLNDVDRSKGFPISTLGGNIVSMGFRVPKILNDVDRN
jgi:hypothetical protein